MIQEEDLNRVMREVTDRVEVVGVEVQAQQLLDLQMHLFLVIHMHRYMIMHSLEMSPCLGLGSANTGLYARSQSSKAFAA